MAAGACLATPGAGQELGPGRWLPWSEDHVDTGVRTAVERGTLSAADLRLILDKLGALAESFRAVDALNPPVGVEVRPHRAVWRFEGRGPDGAGRPYATLFLQLFHPTLEVAGEAGGSLDINVNRIETLLFRPERPLLEDAAGPMYLEPPRLGEVAGFPLYGSDWRNTSHVVLAAHDRPLLLPVSRERYLLGRIAEVDTELADIDSISRAIRPAAPDPAEAEARRAEMRQALETLRQIDPQAAAELEVRLAEMEREIARAMAENEGEHEEGMARMTEALLSRRGDLEGQLAGLSAAARASPAFVGCESDPVSGLCSAEGEGRRVVFANPDYFDPEAPPTAFQLFVVTSRTASAFDRRVEEGVLAAVRRQLNWQALARRLR